MWNPDNNTIMRFIDDYHDAALLWDPRSGEYNNKTRRELKFRELSKKYECSIMDLKLKIKSLRTYFRREFVKVNFNNHDKYRTNWFAYNSMLFLASDDYYPKIPTDSKDNFMEKQMENDTGQFSEIYETREIKMNIINSPVKSLLKKTIKPSVNNDRTHPYKNDSGKDDIAVFGELVGLNVILCPSTFEENLDPASFPTIEGFIEETALQKVLEVESRLTQQNAKPDLVIGADTMVTLNGKLFGKPSTEQEAFDYLSQLNGNKHTVYTGVVLKTASKLVKFCETTDVFFGNLTDEQIKGYIATGEPMDKAGGYGIQGMGATLIRRIEGDYFTVMGLPLHKLSCALCDIYKNDNS